MIHLNFACVTAVAALAAATAPAQNLIAYRPAAAASDFTEVPALSPAFLGAGPGVLRGAIPAPARPATVATNGAIEVDNSVDVVYSTNGLGTIERRTYQRLVCGGFVALAALPIPAACVPVTGMAVDPVSKHLFLTNGATIFRVNPLAGMAILCSFAAAPLTLTGLDYDPATPGQILAVSNGGDVATYNICGGILASTPPTYAPPAAIAVGVARDKSGAFGGNIYVAWNNGQVFNQTLGAFWQAVAANQAGLAYVASPVVLPVAAACGVAAPLASVNALTNSGRATFGFTLCNVPAGVVAAVPLVSFNMGAAAPFWLGAPIYPFWAVPVVGGVATFPVPLGLPAGVTLYQQWAFMCPGGGLGLSTTLQIAVSR